MSDTTMQLQIISANGVFYDGTSPIVTIPVTDGLMQVMPHHEKMLVAVSPGILRFVDDRGETVEAVVSSGSCEIKDNACVILTGTLERPEEIDIERAREALETAKEHMRQNQSMREYKLSQAAMARALLRIKAASGVAARRES